MDFGGQDQDWAVDADSLGMEQGRVVGYQATPGGTHIDCVRFLLRDFAREYDLPCTWFPWLLLVAQYSECDN